MASSSSDEWSRTLWAVLNFLHEEGFVGAEQQLLQELQKKTGAEQSFSGAFAPSSGASHGSAANATNAEMQTLLASLSPRSAMALQLGASSVSEPSTSAPVSAQFLSDLTIPPAGSRSPRSKLRFATQPVPWDEAVNEYETPEDLGYQRKDVTGQQNFVDTEVESELERDAAQHASSTTLHALSSTGNTSNTGSDFAGDSESTCESSISGAVIDLMPSTSGHMTAPPASPQAGAPLFSNVELFPSTGDTAWDLGPIGIRIAEPVTTPTKSSANAASDEPKPVLSRVESLSSSFKDFDFECNEEDMPSRRASSAQDCNLPGAEPVAEVIDFQPTQLAPAVYQQEATSTSAHATSTSTTHATLTPLPLPASIDTGELVLAPHSLSPDAGMLEEGKSDGGGVGSDEPREIGLGGGFSFPVATPPSETQPDHRLFKSWPSVRSSCTSEVIAASDDDHVVADYADDEYLRSVSKPTSRSTSQNLGELSKICLRQGLTEDELSGSQQSGLEGWSFAQPKQPATSSSGHKGDLPHNPHPLSPTSPVKQNPMASCISEPSSTSGYNTSLPFGFGLGSSAAAGTASTSAPGGLASPSSPPAKSEHRASSARQSPTAHEVMAGECSPTGSTSCSTQGQVTPGQGLGTTAFAAASQRPDSSSQPHSSSGGVAALPSPLQVSNPSDQLSEDLTTGAGEDDDEDDEDEDADSAVAAATALEWEHLAVAPASPGNNNGSSAGQDHLSPRYTVNDDGSVAYEYDVDFIARKYEVLDLRIYHRRNRTGFEETKDFPIRMHDLIAGRYQVVDFLGSAAFSRAVQALDIKTGVLVCLKIIKNNKDYLDQSLDEIKLLKYVNTHDPEDKFGIVRLYDYFYYKEHLFLVCELLRANLYEFQKYNRESGDAPYFTNARIQKIAQQVLRSLSFLHALGLIHSDLKPENILIKSYSKCEVKVIDLGSSCFISDQLSSYVQSRSYRAPEVILGLPYDQKVDIWSLGCILAELSSGQVLFQNDSLGTLLARLEGILGPVPQWMVRKGRYAHRFYTRSGNLYEKNSSSDRYELLVSKKTNLRHRIPEADEGLLSFVSSLLLVDPQKRPTALQALQHPWLQAEYPDP